MAFVDSGYVCTAAVDTKDIAGNWRGSGGSCGSDFLRLNIYQGAGIDLMMMVVSSECRGV